ncbi:CRTAC1 family protein [Herpetosiphon gulosus]
MIRSLWQKYHGRFIVSLILLICFGLAREPQLSAAERSELAKSFQFTPSTLPTLSGYPQSTIRTVNPSLTHISAWISSVGAAIAINDLDADGLSNDICYVDPRIDQVIVTPVPQADLRYVPFALNPSPHPYNPTTMSPMGCLPGDFNEDGVLDLLVYYWGRTPLLFFQQPTDGSLTAERFVVQELISQSERWYTSAGLLADFDGDGHQDLILGNYFPDGAQILDENSSKAESMQASMSRAFNGGNKHFLRWTARPDQPFGGQFMPVEQVLERELNHGWTFALGAADLNGDLLPELYIANDFGPDRLLLNQSTPGTLKFLLLEGQAGFNIPSSKRVGHDSFKGMGVEFSDLNSDAIPDIFVSNITTDYGLHESNFAFLSTGDQTSFTQGLAPYRDHSEALGLARSGWGWDIRVADFNNDTSLEIVQATGFVKGTVNNWPELQELATGNDALLADPASWPSFQAGDDIAGHQINPFFVRDATGRYHNLAAELNLDAPHVTRGIATADVDGDGRLDFALANQWESSWFYHNTSPINTKALGLRLRLPLDVHQPLAVLSGYQSDPTPSLAAIGANATITLPDGRTLVAQVDGGNGHSGKRSYDLHFGLGDLKGDSQINVEITWRTRAGAIVKTRQLLKPGNYTILLGSTN